MSSSRLLVFQSLSEDENFKCLVETQGRIGESFLQKSKTSEKKSWFLSLAVWLLHNLELNYIKSLLYTQLHKLSSLLSCPGFFSIHVFANRIFWIVLRNLRWIYFFYGYFVIYMIERGEKCYHCLECYNINILVSTSYCAPTSHFIFIFWLSIDFFLSVIYICRNHIKTSKGCHLLLFWYWCQVFQVILVLVFKLFDLC